MAAGTFRRGQAYGVVSADIPGKVERSLVGNKISAPIELHSEPVPASFGLVWRNHLGEKTPLVRERRWMAPWHPHHLFADKELMQQKKAWDLVFNKNDGAVHR